MSFAAKNWRWYEANPPTSAELRLKGLNKRFGGFFAHHLVSFEHEELNLVFPGFCGAIQQTNKLILICKKSVNYGKFPIFFCKQKSKKQEHLHIFNRYAEIGHRFLGRYPELFTALCN